MEDDVRERLLLRSEEAFLVHGYRGAKLSEIAVAAGISKKTIYRYVDSKEALFALVVEEAIARSLQPATLLADEEDPASVLYRFLQPFVQLSFSERGTYAFKLVLSEAIAFPDIAQRHFATLRATVLMPMGAWLRRKTEAGVLALDDPDSAAEMLIGMAVSERSQRLAVGLEPLPSPEETDRYLRTAIGIFLKGACAA